MWAPWLGVILESLSWGLAAFMGIWTAGAMFAEICPAELESDIKEALLSTRGFAQRKLSTRVLVQAGRLLDVAFGKRHFSKRCFFTSALISSAIIFFLYGLTYVAGASGPYWDLLRSRPAYQWLLVVGVMVVAYNVIPDYLSLVETRWTLSHMTKAKSFVAPAKRIYQDAVPVRYQLFGTRFHILSFQLSG